MRLLISGGGTGGHVYPVLAVANALQKGTDDVELLYVGGRGGRERDMVARAALPYAEVTTGPIRGQSLPRFVMGAVRNLVGTLETWRLMGRFRPQAVFVTGGFVSVPVAMAGWLRRVPVMVYLPDLRPGWAVKLIARFAHTIAVTVEDTARFFPGKRVVVSGYPVRFELLQADRAAARAKWGVPPDEKLMLIFGASQGAHALNVAVAQRLRNLLELGHLVHGSGPGDYAWLQAEQAKLPPELRARYHLYSYMHEELAQAMAAADLVVGRSGASILGEFTVMGLPSVLVPYPYAGAHQRLNARYLASHNAAIVLEESDALGDQLQQIVHDLLTNEARRAELAAGARSLAQPQAADYLAQTLRALARPA